MRLLYLFTFSTDAKARILSPSACMCFATTSRISSESMSSAGAPRCFAAGHFEGLSDFRARLSLKSVLGLSRDWTMIGPDWTCLGLIYDRLKSGLSLFLKSGFGLVLVWIWSGVVGGSKPYSCHSHAVFMPCTSRGPHRSQVREGAVSTRRRPPRRSAAARISESCVLCGHARVAAH